MTSEYKTMRGLEAPTEPASVLFSTGCMFNESGGPYHSLRQTVSCLNTQRHATAVVGTKGLGDGHVTGWAGEVHAFRRKGPYSLHFAPDLARWLKQDARSWDVASMQGVWMHTNALVAEWCIKHGRPYMITAHGNFNPIALRISAWKKWLARNTFMRPVFEHVSCYQALTKTEYHTLRNWGIQTPICIIGNGIEPPIPESACPTAEIIPKPYLKRRTCLYLGRLVPIKGIDRLLRAWGRVGPDDGWQLIIAGSGDATYRSELEQLAQEEGCRNVFFVGHVTGKTKAAWLRQADFTVLPSHSEAFPMAVLESFSYGRPAVLTQACGTPDFALAGAALEVESSDEGIIEGLIQMLAFPASRLDGMGLAAQRLVEERYTWPMVTNKLRQVYEWMRDGGVAPECLRLD